MLLSLHIENVAVIKRLDMDFRGGLIALTGETGSGKSIIIDCLGLLLGAKADKDLIRHGESCAVVSAVFSDFNEESVEKMRSMGVNLDDGALMIRRTVERDGKSSVKINGTAVTLSVLKSISGNLLSIHGQSDTGALQDPQSHREMLDVYCLNHELLSEYGEVYARLSSVRARIKDITEKERERERLKEVLSYQIKDIDSLKLHAGEEEELIDKKLKIKNNEKITKNSEFVFKALKGSEKGSVAHLLERSITALTQLSDVIPDYAEYSEVLRDVLYKTQDIAEEVYAVLEDMEGDPTEALNAIESRLDKISKLKRKYGYTVEEILEFRDKSKKELDELENSDEILRELSLEEEKLYSSCASIALELRKRRVEGAKRLDAYVRETLEFLDMPSVEFYTKIDADTDGDRLALDQYGADKIEFYISANRGAEAQSISKIASGGELARIMLSLKSVIADKDGIDTVIFDEIDAGVSGKTARKIGIKMSSLSKRSQIFVVTHSAQIASLADEHYLISKSDVNGATETAVRALDRDGRITELSRILGGINVTEAQRRAAVDMLSEADRG